MASGTLLQLSTPSLSFLELTLEKRRVQCFMSLEDISLSWPIDQSRLAQPHQFACLSVHGMTKTGRPILTFAAARHQSHETILGLCARVLGAGRLRPVSPRSEQLVPKSDVQALSFPISHVASIPSYALARRINLAKAFCSETPTPACGSSNEAVNDIPPPRWDIHTICHDGHRNDLLRTAIDVASEPLMSACIASLYRFAVACFITNHDDRDEYPAPFCQAYEFK